MGDTVGLRDVARSAGVSVGTASNVWRRPDVVSAATRRRVLDAAATLGFDGPDPGGRLLRTGTAHCVGVVIDQPLVTFFADPYYRRLMEGVADACASRGAGISLIAATEAEDAPWSIRSALVDGFVVFSCGRDGTDLVARCARRGLPLVGIDAEPVDDLTTVRIDDRAAAADVARAVIARGHRRIAIVSLHTGGDHAAIEPTRTAIERVPYVATRLRLHGYLDALDDAAAASDRFESKSASLVGIELAPDDAAGWDALAAALADVDAVIAMSDVTAGELRDRLPERVAIVGFDGLDEGDGLATLVQPIAEKGRLAVHEIYAPSGRRDHVLPTRFVDGPSLTDARGDRRRGAR